MAFRTGDREQLLRLQKALFERGIYVLLSNYIGAGSQGALRCAVFADHTESEIDALAEGILSYGC